MEIFIDIGATNLARALRWHPQGLASWSLSDWSVALAGEVGEVCEVVADDTLHQLPAEIGDVYAYLDLLAQSAGFRLIDCLDGAEHYKLRSFNLGVGALALAKETGKLCDVVKKLNRVRDGLPGNKVTADDLRGQLICYIGNIGGALSWLAFAAGLNLQLCVRNKFNQVSERMGFPERL